MNKSTLKSTLAAAAFALSCMGPAAHAEGKVAYNVSLGQVIAAQGNAALVAIRTELKSAIQAQKPALPARPARKVRVSAPAAAGSIAATAACAE
ncbi:MAG: hypothetical protein ACRETF_05485 [Nevskiaceae bacterium]